MAGDDGIEAELLKMSRDESVPAHLRLGALKQLALFKRAEPPEQRPNGRPTVEGLPPDPLLHEWPDVAGEDGRPQPPDPMADLDFCQVAGRMPHPLYAKVLVRVPEGAGKRALLDAEAWFLRSCRDLGIDTSVDELAQRRRRRRKRAE